MPAVTPVQDRQLLLLVAAWWHDLGYAPGLRDTGCHQIDGARYLAREGHPERLVALVAYHSAGTCEATQRGLLAHLEVWPREAVAGGRRAVDGRHDHRPARRGVDLGPTPLGDSDPRPADLIVGRAMLQAEPEIRAAIARTEQRILSGNTTDESAARPAVVTGRPLWASFSLAGPRLLPPARPSLLYRWHRDLRITPRDVHRAPVWAAPLPRGFSRLPLRGTWSGIEVVRLQIVAESGRTGRMAPTEPVEGEVSRHLDDQVGTHTGVGGPG